MAADDGGGRAMLDWLQGDYGMPPEIPVERLLEAAIDTILERGYEGATMAQIADGAGTGEVTLYRRFRAKEKLLREAIRYEAEKFTREGVAYTSNLQADLERVVQGYHRILKNRGRLVPLIITELPRRPELADALRAPREALKSVASLLGRYQAEGKLAGSVPVQAALELLGPVSVIDALKSAYPLLPALVDPKELVERFLNGKTTSGA
jgi:AcrR family transcriptional regulator